VSQVNQSDSHFSLSFREVVEILETVEVFKWCESIDIEVGDMRLKVSRGMNTGSKIETIAPRGEFKEVAPALESPAHRTTAQKESASADTHPSDERESTDVASRQAPEIGTKNLDGFGLVKSPSVGVFYHAPSPEADPYVQVGSKVSEGDVVGLIEVMKLFTEVLCPTNGVLREILVENNSFVEFNQPLLAIEEN
jgi:acetyl-CoA carboxylase biotin carboxyl carrier protein